jgi:hypothetical protein
MEISCLWCVHKPVTLKKPFQLYNSFLWLLRLWIISMYNDCVGKTWRPVYTANTTQSCQVEGLTAVLLKIQIWVPWNVKSCQKHKQNQYFVQQSLNICQPNAYCCFWKSPFTNTLHPANCKHYSLQRILSCEICHYTVWEQPTNSSEETTTFNFKKSSTLHIEVARSSEMLVNF